MQAARAAKRKQKILAAAGDRMAVVEGAVPKSNEKRLVLDDEEIDPLLATKAGAAPVSDASTTQSPDATKEPTDLIDEALDDVFDEAKSSCATTTAAPDSSNKATKKRPPRPQINYDQLESIMAKPTVFIGNDSPVTSTGDGEGAPDRSQAKRPLAPSSDSSNSISTAAASADDAGTPAAATSAPKGGGLKRPSKKVVSSKDGAAGAPAATADSSSSGGPERASAISETSATKANRAKAARPGFGALFMALFSRATLSYLLPVCLGLLLGLSTLHAHHGGNWANLVAQSDPTCASNLAEVDRSAADDAARARLLAQMGGSGNENGGAAAADDDAYPSGSTLNAAASSADSVFVLLSTVPFFLLLFVARLLLSLLDRLLKGKPKNLSASAPSEAAPNAAAAAAPSGSSGSPSEPPPTTPPSAEAPTDLSALVGGGMLGSVAEMLGPQMAAGGPLAWLGHLLAAFALAKELASDFSALVFVALGVCGVGPVVLRMAVPWLAMAGVLDLGSLGQGTCV